MQKIILMKIEYLTLYEREDYTYREVFETHEAMLKYVQDKDILYLTVYKIADIIKLKNQPNVIVDTD